MTKTLKFYVISVKETSAGLNEKKVKTLKAKSMNTIYENFNKYCKSKGAINSSQVGLNHSVGGLQWIAPSGEVYRLYPAD